MPLSELPIPKLENGRSKLLRTLYLTHAVTFFWSHWRISVFPMGLTCHGPTLQEPSGPLWIEKHSDVPVRSRCQVQEPKHGVCQGRVCSVATGCLGWHSTESGMKSDCSAVSADGGIAQVYDFKTSLSNTARPPSQKGVGEQNCELITKYKVELKFPRERGCCSHSGCPSTLPQSAVVTEKIMGRVEPEGVL